MLTGKDIHAAFRQHDNHAPVWEDISDYGRNAYEAVAETLNTSHIAPLQGLVKEYTEFSKYATPLLKRGRLEWEADSEALAQRAQSLLAEKEQ